MRGLKPLRFSLKAIPAAWAVCFAAALPMRGGLVPERNETPVPVAEVDRAIALATQYLVAACGADGKFVYLVDPATGRVFPDYNIVRHAGAMYALAMCNRFRPDERVVKALGRSAKYLQAHYVRPVPAEAGLLAVWKSPAGKSGSSVAALGATGLGLVGLVELEEIRANSTPIGDLKALGRFLLFLQKADGSFHSKYDAKGRGTFGAAESLYYPGEAALGLALLYEIEPSAEWLAGSEKALVYLAESRRGSADIPADHWALIATARLLSLRGPSMNGAMREALVAHAVQVCTGILGEQLEGTPGSRLNGGFEPQGRTTPASTRLEGLLASLEFLPSERRALRSRIEQAVHRGVRFLLRSQITSGPYAGAIPGAVQEDGEVDSHASEIRIDYVQHFVCAMIRYRALLRGVAPESNVH